MGQEAVGNEKDSHPSEEHRRQRHQTEYLGQRREGQPNADAMTSNVVNVIVLLARLWKNGMRWVRMIWTIRVWVRSDSTNQPV